MNYCLASFIGLFLISNSQAMQPFAPLVLAAWAEVRTAHHTTYRGVLNDNRTVEVEVCTKQRETRNAQPLELHYSGKIGKRRLTRAKAEKMVRHLQEAKQTCFVHLPALRPVKKEAN